MRIIDRGRGWVVVAPWYGAERVVFRGSVRDCYLWMTNQEGVGGGGG